jgi:hypothetical protein
VVGDGNGHWVKVPKDTILGREIATTNGLMKIETIDKKVIFSPVDKLRYF